MKHILALSIAALIAAPAFVAPKAALADSCRTSANKGTAIGGVGGAVLGSQVAGHGNKTEGAILGGVVGAVAGHQVGKSANSKCDDNYRPARTVQCKIVRKHGDRYEVCRGRDGVWRRS
jgi:outer membrane lipoprotein SlyB